MPNGLLLLDPAWIYHFFINLAILTMFYTKKDNVKYILFGLQGFLITSPIMILIRSVTGRQLWGDEKRVLLYVVIGVVIFLLHRLVALVGKEFERKLLNLIRKFIMISMFVYMVLLLVAIPITKAN